MNKDVYTQYSYKFGDFMKNLAQLWLVLTYQLQLSSHDYERKMEGLFFSLVFTEPQYMYFNGKLLAAVVGFADSV